MKILGIIPARYQSSRFPGKPLVDISGKTMIQRVYEQCTSCRALNKVLVATDDVRIEVHVRAFGGNVLMTSQEHLNGTSRCAEAAKLYADYDVIINIQGDEPFISPSQIEDLTRLFLNKETQIATMFKKITSSEQLFNENVVKTVKNIQGKAMYFSRLPIPFFRGTDKEEWISQHDYYSHVGLYGFRRDVLLKIAQLNPTGLEQAESLEQLRWLENGFEISMTETHQETIAIDTPQDLERVLNHPPRS